MIQGALLDIQSSAKAFARRRVVAAGQEKPLRRMVLMAVWLAFLILAAFLVLVILRFPASIVLAVTAGISARCLGQYRNLNRISNSPEAARLAAFEFDGERILCSLTKRPFFATFSRGDCDSPRQSSRAACALPCSIGLSLNLTSCLGPWRVSLALRSDRPCGTMASGGRRYIFPLGQGAGKAMGRADEGGNSNPHRKLRSKNSGAWRDRWLASGDSRSLASLQLDRRGEYRAAIARYLRDRTAEAVLQTEGTAALVNATTELARQDLTNLGAAVATYHEVECRLRAFESMASELRDPLHEMRIEELKCELDQLSKLALHRRWDDLQRHSAWILGELDGLYVKLRHTPLQSL